MTHDRKHDISRLRRVAVRAAMSVRAARVGMAAALLAVGVAACASGQADESKLGLETSTAGVRDIESTVAATGTIEPIRVIDVKSQASGEVLEVNVELGDQVERGELLVRIDPRDVRNAFEQAEADLEVARARSTIAERQLERTSALRDSAVVTEEEYESALLEAANAKAALVKAQTNLDLARERMEDVSVAAPISGTVVEKTVEEGQIITSAKEVTGGTVMLRMADLNEVQVRTLVDETDIGAIEAGLPATIEVEAYPDRQFTGSVLQIEPQAVVEQNVTLFAILTRIQNEEGLLKPGMNADVEILIGRRPDVLAVDNAALKTPEEARQLVETLGMDESLLEQSVRPPASADEPPGDTALAGEAEADDGLPSMAEIRSMSQDERRELFASLTAEQRQELRRRGREAREAQAQADRADPGRPKPAFVFTYLDDGRLTLKPVMIGLSSWNFTEVVAGLADGDSLVHVPLSLVQQAEFLERIRRWTALPGTG